MNPLSLRKYIKQEIECDVTMTIEECPEFIGGYKELYKYIAKNLQYKGEAKVYNPVCGYSKMVVQFDVLKDGKVDNIVITQKTGICPTLEKQVRFVFQNMSGWKPGKKNNESVDSRTKVVFTWHFDVD
ncbi:energy transducer TonB [Emticicia fontis]